MLDEHSQEPGDLSFGHAFPTADGGAGTGVADLWATYAAIRTLRWLDLSPPAEQILGARDYLRSKRNPDGGFAWQSGLASDAWATFYCSQALKDLGESVDNPGTLTAWLEALRATDGGFSMIPGQASDVWATYYACRVYAEIVGVPIPNPAHLINWFQQLQLADGGITWCPGHREGDIRTFYYASSACRAAEISEAPWDLERLQQWVQSQQSATGAFAFGADEIPCIWATFRATGGMRVWGWRPRNRSLCLSWLNSDLHHDGFKRWDGYSVSDIWANFCGVGAMRNLGVELDPEKKSIVSEIIANCAAPNGGYTYRNYVDGGDALSTAASAIVGVLQPESCSPSITRQLGDWLRGAQMPAEHGVMYMPARGAEVRCTLWAHTALKLLGGQTLDMERVLRWLTSLQNPDGGFGYWLGRGSDMTSTASAVALLAQCPGHGKNVVDLYTLKRFVESCRRDREAANLPGGKPTTSSSAQAARILAWLGCDRASQYLVEDLTSRRIMGGFFNSDRALPDLHTTYQSVLSLQQVGLLDAGLRHGVASFLRKLRRRDGGIGWTPLSQMDADPLVLPLYLLLKKSTENEQFILPELIL